MSGLIVGLVLRHPITEKFNSDAKFIATVYADHAWEDGTHAYPAVETVAGITGLSSRTVQRYLRVLEDIGMLIPNGKGPRGTNRYDFPLQSNEDGSVRLAVKGGVTVSPPPEQPEAADSGDRLSPRQADGGDRESGDTESGDTSVTQTNNPSLDLVVKGADFAKVAKFYEQEIGALTPLIADAIRDACTEYPPDWIPEAISIAVESNARNWKYVLAILKNCKSKGKRPSLNKLEAKHGNNRTGNSAGTKPKGSTQAGAPAYSDADRAAAERVRARQHGKVS
jgi:DnaD/phage-associated family protein